MFRAGAGAGFSKSSEPEPELGFLKFRTPLLTTHHKNVCFLFPDAHTPSLRCLIICINIFCWFFFCLFLGDILDNKKLINIV